MKTLPATAIAFAIFAVCVPASAHPTLERPEASPGTFYKAVLSVPHGCKGSPTTKVTVKIPDGVIGVKPQPKPGWSLNVVRAPYGKTYDFIHGMKISEGAREITWTGKLDDAYFDEFVFVSFLANTLPAGTTMYFPVMQECETGKEAWVDIPAAGQDAHALKAPAASLRLVAAAGQSAPSFEIGALVIEAPWLRATPRGAKVAGGYMKITNTGAEPDGLVGGSLDQAGRFEIHEMKMENDVMKMRQLSDGLVIAPGQSVEFKPGGYHIMGVDLASGFTEGQKIKGTLVFEKAGTVSIEYEVAPIGGDRSQHHHH